MTAQSLADELARIAQAVDLAVPGIVEAINRIQTAAESAGE